jgi:hypothetical protein
MQSSTFVNDFRFIAFVFDGGKEALTKENMNESPLSAISNNPRDQYSAGFTQG